jgi:O-antigen biosynthesis protein
VAAVLFLLQPIARLTGRLRGGLTPWRRRGELALAFPWPRRRTVWSERWRPQTERLLELERDLRTRCMSVVRGGDTDRWDIQVRLGPLGSARLRVAVEEHGQGRQLVRYRVWPRWSRALPAIVALLALWIAGCAAYDDALAAVIGVVLLLVVLRACQEAGAGVALVLRAIGDAVEVPHSETDSPDLMDDLRVPHPAVSGWNGSHVHVSTNGELRERSR